jgi:hypothetical protein
MIFKVFSNEAAAGIEQLIAYGFIKNTVEAADTAKFIRFVRLW